MAAVATNPPTFSLFSTLPAELRNAIWHEALPDAIEPALVSFKLGYWRLQGTEDDPELIFRHDLLDVHIEMPLAFVNHEARGIALARARELGLMPRARRDQYPIFVRPFEPTIDALHLGPGQLEDIIHEVGNRTLDPDFENRYLSIQSAIRSIAMSETVIRNDSAMEMIPHLIHSYMSVKQLLVVVNAPPELQSADDHNGEVKPHWGFICASGDVFSWNRDHQRFELHGGSEHFGDGVVRALVEGSEQVTEAFTPGFEIQPVLTVRR